MDGVNLVLTAILAGFGLLIGWYIAVWFIAAAVSLIVAALAFLPVIVVVVVFLGLVWMLS